MKPAVHWDAGNSYKKLIQIFSSKCLNYSYAQFCLQVFHILSYFCFNKLLFPAGKIAKVMEHVKLYERANTIRKIGVNLCCVCSLDTMCMIWMAHAEVKWRFSLRCHGLHPTPLQRFHFNRNLYWNVWEPAKFLVAIQPASHHIILYNLSMCEPLQSDKGQVVCPLKSAVGLLLFPALGSVTFLEACGLCQPRVCIHICTALAPIAEHCTCRKFEKEGNGYM